MRAYLQLLRDVLEQGRLRGDRTGTGTRSLFGYQLRVDLSEYDAVFWSASGTGYGDNHTDTAAFMNLTRYVMDGGRVVEQAPPDALFGNPKSERTKTFLSQILAH